MNRLVVSDGIGALRIHFEYEARLLSIVRSLPARRWNATEKYWSVPEAHVVEVVKLLQPEGFELCEVTQRLYQERGGILNRGVGEGTPARTAGPGPHERSAGVPPTSAGASSDFTVSRLNRQVQAALRELFPGSIWLVGEVSGFNKAADRSIVTFQLIEHDDQGKLLAEIKATLFERERRDIQRRLAAAGDPFRLEDEIQVRVRGRVELYVPWGLYRFFIEDLDVTYTLGEAARRREEIRRRLAEDGILERNRSLPFPELPLRVGLVTSLGSDAYKDVLKTLQESGFAFCVMAHGARVQGRALEPSVLNALDWFRARSAAMDVLLICRGGGSRTDLAWFDSERIARAIAAFPVPVVVGIGHEQDFSALDFVGRRAKTPTAAAQMLVRRVEESLGTVEARLDGILREGRMIIESAASELASRADRIPRTAAALIELSSERVESRERRLFLLDPRRVVERGYAIVRSNAGTVITDPARAPRGTRLTAELKQGTLRLRSDGPEEA